MDTNRRTDDRMSIASLVGPSNPSYGGRQEPEQRPRQMQVVLPGSFQKPANTSDNLRVIRPQGPVLTPSGSQPPASDLKKLSKSARPVYTEEQKFFIMYARIVLDESWVDIEDRFAAIFGYRSKDGITSMYYRIRKSWGLKDVLKTGPDSYVEDKQAVRERALYFSEHFLRAIGYYL